MPGLGAYLVVGGVAAVATFLLTPLVRVLSIKFGAVVAPDERRVHDVPTPTLGGVAMFGGFLLAMFVGLAARRASTCVFTSSSEPLGVVLGAAIIFAVGLLDDLCEWSAAGEGRRASCSPAASCRCSASRCSTSASRSSGSSCCRPTWRRS